MNLEMVKAGYAEVYRGTAATGFDNAPYWKAKKEARVAKKGVRVQGDKYMRPREWRKITARSENEGKWRYLGVVTRHFPGSSI